MGTIPDRIGDLLSGYVAGQGRAGGLAIVGGAPGSYETEGKVLQGPAGETLRRMFAALGAPVLERVAFITYAVPYRTPDNRAPTSEELEHYREHLVESLKEARPRVVLLMGNSALHALSDNHKLKITHERGKVREYEGFLCMPTFNPSNVRRNPGNYKYLKLDVLEVRRLARGGELRKPPDVKWKVVPEALYEKAVDAILAKPGTRGADIETTGLDLHADRILDLGVEITDGFVLAFTGDFSPGTPLNKAIHRLFATRSGEPELRFSWHNGKFDCSFLQHVGIPARVDDDGLLLHYCLDESQGGHDLKTLSMELLGADGYDLTKREKENMARVPKKRRLEYMAKDVVYTRALRDKLVEVVEKDPDLRKLYYETLIPVSNLLTRVEAWGILVDLEHLNELDKELTEERDQLTQELRELLDRPDFNPRSSKQVQEVMYGATGFRFKPLRGFGRTSKALVMERLETKMRAAGKGDHPACRFLALMRKIRKVNKLKGTYVDGVRRRIKADGRIHTSFKQHGTRTGRLSSEEPNMHAIPRDPKLRSLFRAPKGFVIMEADWSQVELRLIADKSRDPGLVKVYQNGEDLHDEVVNTVIRPLLPNQTYTEQRYQAKIVNFGTAYGRGADSMARDYDLPLENCKRIIDGWRKRFAVAHAWLEGQATKALSGKPLVTRFGRKRRFGLINRETRSHIANEGKNFEIQSEASDLTARCAVEVAKTLPEGVKIVNTVHDSLIFEIPEEPRLIREFAIATVRKMETTAMELFNSPVPFKVDIKLGVSWGKGKEVDTETLQNMSDEELRRFIHGDKDDGSRSVDSTTVLAKGEAGQSGRAPQVSQEASKASKAPVENALRFS